MGLSKKPKFYRQDKILSHNADYNMIYSERSNGKTFSALEIILFGYHKNGVNINGYIDNGSAGAIIRRYEEDFKGKYGSQQWDNFINNEWEGNIIEKRFKGRWNAVNYYTGKWFLCLKDETGKIIEADPNPFCYAFGLSADEHYKSQNYPSIKNIVFDEFITRQYYLINEFVLFQSVLSTIIRLKNDVHIWMLANSINKYGCPYFTEMGLKHIKEQKKNSIDIYNYETPEGHKLSVAVEYAYDEEFSKNKESNKYFAFDNPKLKMIQSGDWEINIYPHLPCKYKPKDIKYYYFIKYEDIILQAEIIKVNKQMFTYIHYKTTPIKEDEKHIIYHQDFDPRKNYKRKVITPESEIEKKIAWFWKYEQVYYQNNEIGEICRNWLLWQRQH